MVAARATKARARRQRQGGDSTGHEPVNQSPCLDQDLFLSCCRLAALPSPDFRLFGSFFRCFSASRFGKRISALFCHLSRILIEKRRGAQCRMWVIICHRCLH